MSLKEQLEQSAKQLSVAQGLLEDSQREASEVQRGDKHCEHMPVLPPSR